MRFLAVVIGILFGPVAGLATILLVAVVLTRNDLWSPDPKNADETVEVYRHIRGNWYLFYEYIPG